MDDHGINCIRPPSTGCGACLMILAMAAMPVALLWLLMWLT